MSTWEQEPHLSSMTAPAKVTTSHPILVCLWIVLSLKHSSQKLNTQHLYESEYYSIFPTVFLQSGILIGGKIKK